MWSVEKINQFIADKVEENLYLDYKASDALGKSDSKKNEISKDVSAFANSDGGVIIYGIKEFRKDTNFLPEKIDPVKRDEFSKETLEQIINTRISPTIHGIIITPTSPTIRYLAIACDETVPNRLYMTYADISGYIRAFRIDL